MTRKRPGPDRFRQSRIIHLCPACQRLNDGRPIDPFPPPIKPLGEPCPKCGNLDDGGVNE